MNTSINDCVLGMIKEIHELLSRERASLGQSTTDKTRRVLTLALLDPDSALYEHRITYNKIGFNTENNHYIRFMLSSIQNVTKDMKPEKKMLVIGGILDAIEPNMQTEAFYDPGLITFVEKWMAEVKKMKPYKI